MSSISSFVITFTFQINSFGKDMNPLMSASHGLNSITVVFLQGWFWHWITHKGWYTIKQRNKNYSLWTYLNMTMQKWDRNSLSQAVDHLTHGSSWSWTHEHWTYLITYKFLQPNQWFLLGRHISSVAMLTSSFLFCFVYWGG